MEEKNAIKQFITNLWPSVYRIINILFYSGISLLKKFFYLAIKQIKEA